MAYTKRDKNTSESEIFFLKPDKWFKIRFYIVGEVHRQDYKQRKRGENWFSYDKIMHATWASKKQVFGALDWLRDRGMIRTQKETRWMTVEVLNYAKYQDVVRDKGNRKETERKQKGNTEGVTIEEEEKKEEYIRSSEQKEYVWKNYPHARKGKKQDTIKNFSSYAPEVVIWMVTTYKREVQVWLQDAKYVPASERRSRDFVVYSDVIKKQKDIAIYQLLLEKKKELIPLRVEDVGKEYMQELYNIIQNEKHNNLLSSLQK